MSEDPKKQYKKQRRRKTKKSKDPSEYIPRYNGMEGLDEDWYDGWEDSYGSE